MNARTQDSADIPWSRHGAFRKHVAACREHSARIAKLRTRFRILALWGAYLVNEQRALRRFWFSFCVGSLGHGLAIAGRHHVGALLFGIHFTGTFADCRLPVKAARDPESHVVHPACVCATTPRQERVCVKPAEEPWIKKCWMQPVIRKTSIKAGGWPSKVFFRAIPSVADGLPRSGPSVADGWPRAAARAVPPRLPPKAQVRVPWYVKNTTMLKPTCQECLSLLTPGIAPLRFQRMSTAHHEFGLSQRACRIPPSQPVLFKAIDEGLAHVETFMCSLAQETEDYCCGDVGMEEDMRALLDDACLCLSFADILEQAEPPQTALDAALRLYRALHPQLIFRPFPDPEWRMTPDLRRWPSVAEGVRPRDKDIVLDQYVRWRRQVRDAAAAPNSWYAVSWRRVRAHRVQLLPGVNLRVLLVLFRRLTRQSWKTAPRATRFRVIALAAYVQSFCRPDVNPLTCPAGSREAEPPPTFEIDAGKLHLMIPLGGGLRAAIMKTRCKALRGRHALVWADVTEPCERTIAGSLEQDRLFSRGCWHWHRLFCLARRMGATSAWAERWAHSAKLQWGDLVGPSASTILERFAARAGGLRVDGTDNDYLEAIAGEMWRPKGLNHRGARAPGGVKKWRDRRAAAAAKHMEARALVAGAQAPPPPAAELPAPLARSRFGARSSSYMDQSLLEPGDELLLDRFKRRKIAAMPFQAGNKKQWWEDLTREDENLRATKHGRKWLLAPMAGHVAPVRPKRSVSSSSSSSSSSTSSSSSSSPPPSRAPGARPARVLATMPAAVAGAAPSPVAGEASASPAAGDAAPHKKKILWVCSRSGILHGRVDGGGSGDQYYLCAPFRKCTSALNMGESSSLEAARAMAGAEWHGCCASMLE